MDFLMIKILDYFNYLLKLIAGLKHSKCYYYYING